MGARIMYPEGTVRTREEILTGQTVIAGHVWIPCWNCGGHGTYPSACDPPGMCRLYCWSKGYADPIAQALGGRPLSKDRSDPTYGKLAYSIDKFVKREQAADRKLYRDQLTWEATRVEREARIAEYRAKQEAEALAENERRVAELAAKRTRKHIGEIGQRVHVIATVDRVVRIQGGGFRGFGDRYLVGLRDNDENALVWWTDARPAWADEGEQVEIIGTVKDHGTYRDEAQTTVQRVKLVASSALPSPEGR